VDTTNSQEHKPIEAPSGLDLHPQPQKAVRISRRASMAILSVIVLLLLSFAYGGYRRTVNNQTAARDAGLLRGVTPATQAGSEFMQATPAGTVPMALRPPGQASPQTTMPSCGTDPKTGQFYRFSPLTGQPCDGLPQERVVVRQPNAMRTQTVPATSVEQTPEERRVAAAYQREQEAIQAPTNIRNSGTSSLSTIAGQPAPNDLSQGRSPEPCSGRAAGR